MTISLDSLTTNPTGSENGLVVRNIPSGTQNVSGETTADQGLPNSLSEAWPVNITDGYNMLGTYTNPVMVSSVSMARTPITYYAIGATVPYATEGMITLTPTSNYITGTAASSFAATAGKILRIQSIAVLPGEGGTTTNIRISNSGSVTTSTRGIREPKEL